MNEVAANWLQLYRKTIGRMSRRGQVLNLILAALLAVMCFVWTYHNIGIVYAVNDDVGFHDIASGNESGVPDGHLIYVKYVLGWIITRLYLVNAHFDWYGLTLLALLCACLLLVLFRALEVPRTFWQSIKVTAFVVVGYGLFGMQHVAEFQFTTVAGMLAGTAIFWLWTSEVGAGARRFVDPAICLLLMLASYTLRSNVFLLSLPFAGIVFLSQILAWRKRTIDRLLLPLSLLVGVGAIFLVENAAYSDPAWKSYLQFNDLDTQIYDYCGLPRYAENQPFYQSLGVSNEMYDLLSRWTFVPNPSANIQTFQAIVQKCRPHDTALGALIFSSSHANGIVYNIFSTMLDSKYALVNIACIVLAAFVIARRRADFDYRTALLILSLVSIHLAEWAFLVASGRYPDRVIWAIYLIEVLLLTAVVVKESEPVLAAQKRAYQLTVGVLAAVLAVGAVDYQTQVVQKEVHTQASINRKCARVEEYIADRPDRFYFVSTSSFSYCTRTFQVRPDIHFDNFAVMGGWDYLSPVYMQNWRAHGITDVQQDLIRRSDILVLIRPPDSIEYLVAYYRSVDVNVVANQVDRISIADSGGDVIVFKLGVVHDSVPLPSSATSLSTSGVGLTAFRLPAADRSP